MNNTFIGSLAKKWFNKSISVWLRRTGFSILDQAFFSGANFAINILLARWMGADEYGAFALVYSIFLFLAGFHNSMILEPMSVIGAANYNKQLNNYLKKTVQFHFSITLIISLISLLISLILKKTFINAYYIEAFVGISLSLPFILLLWLCRRAYYLRSNPRAAFWMSFLYAISVMIGIYGLKEISKVTLFNVFCLLGGVSLAISLMFFKHIIAGKVEEDSQLDLNISRIIKENWHYGRWVILITIVHWLSGNLYYFFTAGILGIEEVGALRAIQNLIFPIGQVLTALGLFFLPWASKSFIDKGIKEFRSNIAKISLLMIMIAFTYFVFIVIADDYLMVYLYNNNYQQYTYLLPFFAIIPVISAFGNGLQIGLRAYQRPSKIFVAYAASALITVTLGVWMVKFWGLKGTAIGGMVAGVVQFVFIFKYWQSIKRL